MGTTIPAWLTLAAWIWLVLSFACAALLVLMLIRQPQAMAIMNVVWPITALYLGPVAVWCYWALARSRKEPVLVSPMPGMGVTAMPPMTASPPAVQKPFWQSIIVEATHCGAGCTLGDIAAECIIAFGALSIAGSRLYAEFLGDYILAFTFGVAFQYFAIAPMRGLSLRDGIVAAIKADAISLTAFEIGLFAAMYGMSLLPFHRQLGVDQPAFWLLMQAGMVIGFLTSYPANWFLVRVGIKEVM